MFKKYLSILLVLIVLFGSFMAFYPATSVKAGTETYNHIIPFTITDTSGVARTNVPVIITYDTNGRLVAYGLTNATCTDTYVDSSGASNSPVGSGTAYSYLMNTANITCVIPSLPAYGSVTINLYTGYSPLETSFPIITGTNGYVSTNDTAVLEPTQGGTTNYTIETSLLPFYDTTTNITLKSKSLRTWYNPTTTTVAHGIYQAYSMNYTSGSSQNTTIPDADSLSFGSDVPFSISLFFKPTTFPAMSALVNKSDSTTLGEYSLRVDSSGNVSFTLMKSDISAWLSRDVNSTSLSAGQWYNIVATYDGSKVSTGMKIYISGTLQTTDDMSSGVYTGMSNTYEPLCLGSYNNVQYLNGSLAQVRIYNIELTPTQVSSIYAGEAPETNLVGKWNMNEGTGLPKDSTGNGHNAIANTGTWVTPSDLSGGLSAVALASATMTNESHIVKATDYEDIYLNLDASGDSVNCGSGASLNITGQRSLGGWIKPNGDGEAGAGRIYDKERYRLTTVGGVVRFTVYKAGNPYFVDSAPYNVGQWNYVMGVYDGANLKISIAGGAFSIGDALTGSTDSSAADTAFIGNDAANNRCFDGGLDEITVYSRAMGLAEIQANYALGRTGSPTPTNTANLQGFWRLQEASGATAYDSSGNANTGTITNSTWVDRSLKIWVDNVEVGYGASANISVPNTSSNWIWQAPQFDYIKLTKGGVEKLWYQPQALITSNLVIDRDGTKNGDVFWGVNSNITVTGGDIMTSQSATSVGTTSVMMQSSFDFIGTYASVYLSFQYGLDTSYGYFTTETSAAAAQTFAVTLTGLTPNTTYHYRAVARSGTVYSYGADITVTTSYSSSSQGSVTIYVISAAVFQGYTGNTTNDWLFCAEIVCTYPPYYPTGDPKQYFQMQLLAPDGVTLLGASPIAQWGDRPESIYLNSSANVSYGENITVRVASIISGLTVTTSYSTNYSLQWRGNDLTRLDDWCLGVATNMQNTDGTILTNPYLTTLTGYGVVITNAAGGYFTNGIPNIAQIRPNLFQTAQVKPTMPTMSMDITNPGGAMANKVGAQISGDALTVGTILGLNGQQFLLYLIMAIVALSILFTISRTQGFGSLGALFMCVPIIGASVYFNILNIVIPLVLAFTFALLFIRQFVWKTL